MLIPATKMRLIFKITYTFFFSQVMLAGKLTRSYFNTDTVAFKLLQIAFKLLSYWVVKLPLKASGCYSTNLRFLDFLNNKYLSRELKILSYDGLWENKKMTG